jgi:hypothetical protein
MYFAHNLKEKYQFSFDGEKIDWFVDFQMGHVLI